MLFISLFILIGVDFARSATAPCYYRNGTQTTSDYSPCSSDVSDPMSTVCCATWDTCLPNGLCQSFDKVIWRESCTKQNWNEGGCQELCSNEREAQRNDNIKVTSCEGKNNATSTTWCCGGNDACCADGSDVPRHTIARRFGDTISAQTPTASLSASISSPSASATSSAPAISSSMTGTGNGKLSTGAKVGIGLGASLGAIALIALGIFIYKALQWRKKALVAAPPCDRPADYPPIEVYRYQQEMKPAQLAGVESAVHKMPGSRNTSELCVMSPNVTNGNHNSGL
ncbi:hypothetical protein BKA66DRAFT_516005 [Pyrenochaeta sp. MPI-SDFR-AT-0127]|nr:hypothetical protein BKA66DRAFT_516005 [Pyrenochaeta sp. MPI-SDFR-AT-0127]